MKRIKAFVFDLDGIIVDTTRYHYLSWKSLAHTFGYNFEERDNEALKGANRMTSLNIILARAGLSYSDQEKEIMCERKNEIYLELITNISVADTLPGIIPFIRLAKKEGLRIGLGSSSRNAKNTIRRLQLGHLFDVQLDANDVPDSKPLPDIYLQVAHLLEIDPDACLIFEDAYNGIAAAKKAGMLVVGMGHQDQVAGADLIIDSFENNSPALIFDKLSVALKGNGA